MKRTLSKLVLETGEKLDCPPSSVLLRTWCYFLVGGAYLFWNYVWRLPPVFPKLQDFCSLLPFRVLTGFEGNSPYHWLVCKRNPFSHLWTHPPVPAKRLSLGKEDPCIDLGTIWKGLCSVSLTTPTAVKVDSIILWKKWPFGKMTDGLSLGPWTPSK